MKDLLAKAETLTEALPWIKSTWGSTVVIKYGGATMVDPALREMVASDIVLMKLVGINPVIVHGGGPEITSYMDRLDMPVEFYDGMRVTDDEAMEVVKMVLVGKVNKELVSAINHHGRLAVGISGDDANLIKARPVSERLGRVGEVESIDPTVLNDLIGTGSSRSSRPSVTATTGAPTTSTPTWWRARSATALGAAKVIFLTDVDGIYADFEDKGSLVSALSLVEAEQLIAVERLTSGMIPKVAACARALRSGVPRAHILNGTVPHAVLLEVYTDEGIGTMITADGGRPPEPDRMLIQGGR